MIAKRNETFKELFDSNDMDKLTKSLYAPDCKMMVPGEKTAEGNGDAKKLLSTLKAEGAIAISLGAIEVGPMGGSELLYERGDYSFNNADNVTMKIGKYVKHCKPYPYITGIYIRSVFKTISVNIL